MKTTSIALIAAYALSGVSCGMTSVISPDGFVGIAGAMRIDLSAVAPGTYSGEYELVLPPGNLAKNRRFLVTGAIGAAGEVDVTIDEPRPLARRKSTRRAGAGFP